MRHEVKFSISTAMVPAIAKRLKDVMSLDAHSNENGGYKIRSLYFDDENKSAYFDKLAGVSERVKYRIRLYENNGENLFLESKRKYGDIMDKTTVKISKSCAIRLMNGDPTGLDESDSPLLNDVYAQMTIKRLRPFVIVDYDRQAFVHIGGNTRVTIDRHVRSGLRNIDIFDSDMLTIDAMDPALSILEVKYDSMLPDFIASAISCFPGIQSAISKYVMCARFII